MVKTGHERANPESAIVPVAYQNRAWPGSRLEVLQLSELKGRIPRELLGRPERIDFHLWLLVTRGGCRHMVDFEHHACRAGTVLHVRPGQVHAWDLRPRLAGILIIATPELVPPARARQETVFARLHDDLGWPPAIAVPRGDRARVTRWFATLAATYREADDAAASRELLGHLAAVALLDVARSCATGADPDRRAVDRPAAPAASDVAVERVRRLRAAIERSFRVTRGVADYATALGCSPKTLDRASRLVTGRSVKALVSARVVLEAKRLLAHGDDTTDAIGAELGFSEPTNFGKFFRAHVGVAPGAFRARFR